MWKQLSHQSRPLYQDEAENESCVHWNRGEGKWWIDGHSGAGVYSSERWIIVANYWMDSAGS